MKILTCLFLLLSYQITFPQDTLYFNADYIPYTDTTLIFLPDNFDPSEEYPLLFMLHGWSGNYKQWNGIIDLKSYATEYQFIIACPDGFYDSWYLDSPLDSNYLFESFFFNDLVPDIFRRFNISKENIFITGLSMGGHGAISLLFRNSDFFKAAGSTSGILDLTKFPDKWEIKDRLGNYNDYPQNWISNSAINLVDYFAGSKKKIIVDCGTADFAFDVNVSFNKVCKENGILIKFIEQPGKHSREYWKRSIEDHFLFFKQRINE